MKNLIHNSKRKGVSTLIVIIVLSAVTLMIASSAAMIGIDETQTGMKQNKALETLSATDGCMEEALIRLNGDRDGYTGESLTIGEVSCTITVSGAGDGRTINVTSTHEGTYTREIQAEIDLSSGFEISSWQELTD